MLTEKQINQVKNYVCNACEHGKCGTYLCRLDHLDYDGIERIFKEKLKKNPNQLEFPFKQNLEL